MRIALVVMALAAVAHADTPKAADIPKHELRGVLDGKAFTPTSVEIRRDGNQEWWLLARNDDTSVEVQVPIVFEPTTGACIEQPIAFAGRPAFNDLRGGTNNYTNYMGFVLQLDTVSSAPAPATPTDTSHGTARGGILVKFGEKGERGWFGGRFEKLPINVFGGAPNPHPCNAADRKQRATGAFQGKMRKTALVAKTWRLVEIPTDTKLAHWALFADLEGGHGIRVELETPAANTCVASNSGREISGTIPEVEPPLYTVAFDTVDADHATGWVVYDWLEGSRASGRFDAKIERGSANAHAARRCK
jgi:hypothetical protein